MRYRRAMNALMRMLTILALLGAAALAAPAARAETGFLDREVTVEGAAYRYQVYVPRGARPGQRLPLILALHGAGERGVDGLLQTEVGLASAIRRFPHRYPAVVVFPQTPPGTVWHDRSAKAAMAALDAAEREFGTDPDRVYLTGLSMGGNGSWRLAYLHPERFAAMAVVCGFVAELRLSLPYPAIAAGAPEPYAAVAERVKAIPTWIFHGDADPVVPVEESRRMAAALQALGAPVRYLELPGVGHNAWDPAYQGEALPAWLFQQRKAR